MSAKEQNATFDLNANGPSEVEETINKIEKDEFDRADRELDDKVLMAIFSPSSLLVMGISCAGLELLMDSSIPAGPLFKILGWVFGYIIPSVVPLWGFWTLALAQARAGRAGVPLSAVSPRLARYLGHSDRPLTPEHIRSYGSMTLLSLGCLLPLANVFMLMVWSAFMWINFVKKHSAGFAKLTEIKNAVGRGVARGFRPVSALLKTTIAAPVFRGLGRIASKPIGE